MNEAWLPSRVAWALRKIFLPIRRDDFVLDVGSGGNPHPAADLILDKYVDPIHRLGVRLRTDRPFVLADAVRMPFRDKTFDFAVAFHVLEHMPDPASFLNELQRVAKAGYIETPNVFFERLVPYDIHLLEVMECEGRLVIRKKPGAHPDRFLSQLNVGKNDSLWSRFFRRHPKYFHVQYLWRNNIDFMILNPETSLEWFREPDTSPFHENAAPGTVGSRTARSLGLDILRRYYRIAKPSRPPLAQTLVCVECHGKLYDEGDRLVCRACKLAFPSKPVPNFCVAHPF
jgi:SAM-dependent methyltransferase